MSENDTNEQQTEPGQQQKMEAIVTWFQSVQQVLKQQFEGYEVEGQMAEHPAYGPIFTYTLSHDGNLYTCGFFLNELLHAFQNKENPEQWLSSFYVDLLRSPESRPLPNPPQSEEEAKTLVEQVIVPYSTQVVREEFPGENVYVNLEVNPEHGPVLEAGFPSIKEGNNTCAMPLQFLYTLYILNRDPAEPLVTALYTLQEQLQTD